jgi:chemotaxis protein methyltransferase CheR
MIGISAASELMISQPVRQSERLPRITDRGLATLSALVRDYSGICIGVDKHQLVENRLSRRVRELGLASLEAYAQLVRADRSHAELETLVDLITTNHTAFFREPDHFNFLFDRLVPEIRSTFAPGLPLRIWSAASSSGEEPYTLAMLASEDAEAHSGHRYAITASDISRRMLAVADRGIYTLSGLSAVPKSLLHRYFERGVGPQEGRCRVRRSLREMVAFRRINLLDGPYPLDQPQHVIFCRNVLIYFDTRTRRAVAQQLLDSLAPGGYLVVGYSESLSGLLPGIQACSHGVYRRP